jgi:integrase
MKLAKAKKADSAHDHLVPLSGEAVEVLRAARNGPGIISADLDRVGRYVFPGAGGRPLGEGAIRDLYARTCFHGRHVPHGWRATFSTLLNERFPADRALIDRALAHAGKDKVEAAYNRAEHLGRRRWLFQLWGEMLGR